MPVVAFEVLSVTASHVSRKPAAHADREGSTPFADMLETTANKPPAKDAAKDTGTDPASAAQPAPTQARADDAEKASAAEPAPKTAATTPADTAAPAEPADDTTAADLGNAAAAGFEAAVTEATEPPAAADVPKDAKSDDAKSVDGKGKSDDKTSESPAADIAAATTDATISMIVDTTSNPVAAVVTAPAEPAAVDAAPADPKPTAAAPVGATPAAATPAVTADQTLAQAAATVGLAEPAERKDDAKTTAKTDVKAEARTDSKADTQASPGTDATSDSRTDKPQAVAKLETPPLLTDAATGNGKQAAQAQQPQQTQGQKPVVDASTQPAKPAPARNDAPAPDIASIAKPADATQPMPLLQSNGLPATQSADQAAATPAVANAPQAVALPVQGIAIEIAGKALAGKNRFDIRLDPPELGRIHVRLDVDHKGEVTSIITADRSDTFDMLRRDAQALERALQDAGVKTSSNGLQFSLRDHGAGQHNLPAQFADTARVVVHDDALDTEIINAVYRPPSGNRAGVDIRV